MKLNPFYQRDDAAAEMGPAALASPSGRTGWIYFGAIAGILSVALFAIVLYILASAPAPQVSIAGTSGELSPDRPITMVVPRFGTDVSNVILTEATVGADGRVTPSNSIPVELVPVGETGALDLYTTLQLRRSDGAGLLQYDRLYSLTVYEDRKAIEFPLPRDIQVAQDFTFRTLATPKVIPTAGVMELNYQKPAQIQWTSPVRSFSVEITPQVAHQTRVGTDRQDVGYVDLIGADPDQTYDIKVVEAVGVNGAPLLSAGSVTVHTAAPPKLLADGTKLIDGNLIVVPWDRKITNLRYEITPEVQSVVEVDPNNPTVKVIRMLDPSLSQRYTVAITGATADNEAPLLERHEFSVTTPPPLEITRFRPKHGSIGVEQDSPIDITFSEPIKDRASAEAAITITPSIKGRFEWPEPNQMRFVAEEKLPLETDVIVHFAAGPEAFRSDRGGYLQSTDDFSFKTVPNKVIDVDLTRQVLTLLEGGVPVFTTLIATGVRGAETPTGTFHVEYKMTKTRMRGVNPSGRAYDLPDVPWVMPFLGDYAMHGAYWRETYGTPQSNGCVSMPTAAAKLVFDWTPEGTPVRIHY